MTRRFPKNETCTSQKGIVKMDKITYKTSRTIKDYFVKDIKGYGPYIIPAGSVVTNNTALGPDDCYHFWEDWQKAAEKITGFKNSLLAHDLTYYGLNIPAKYCSPYTK